METWTIITIIATTLVIALLVFLWASFIDGGISGIRYDWESDSIGYWKDGDIRITIKKTDDVLIKTGELKVVESRTHLGMKRKKQHYQIIINNVDSGFTTNATTLKVVMEKNNFKFRTE